MIYYNRYLKSAERGNTKAQTNLGWCYRNGKGVDRDFEKANYWFDLAEKQQKKY
jgi:TPR repeat protein